MTKIPKITRVEVIDDNGRSYVNWNERNNVFYQLQDEGRTLKVFVNRQDADLMTDEQIQS